MIKHYVEFIYPGAFMSETDSYTIETRTDIPKDIPECCYAYRFFDRKEVECEGEKLIGKKKNYSGWFYLGGEVLTIDDVKRTMPGERILISNMEGNNIEKVIRTRTGNVVPFEKADTIIEVGK